MISFKLEEGKMYIPIFIFRNLLIFLFRIYTGSTQIQHCLVSYILIVEKSVQRLSAIKERERE